MGKHIAWKEPDLFSLEDLMTLRPQSMQMIIHQMSEEHKQALMDECLYLAEVATTKGTAVGMEWTDYRGVCRFPSPYNLAKKYMYLYTCISGWQFEADLREKEHINEECDISQETIDAFISKGWNVSKQ